MEYTQPTVELVVHCWRFSRVLNYFLSALTLYPPQRVNVVSSIFYSIDDQPTVDMLDFFDTKTRILRWPLPLTHLLRRAIGRDMAAENTKADVLWWIDADYFLGDGCLDMMADADWSESKLWYPRETFFNGTKEGGDEYARLITKPKVRDISRDDFVKHKCRRAIGGLQIVSGEVAREYGYCPHDKRLQKPLPEGCEEWQNTKGDMRLRKYLGTGGKAIDLPNVYRLRQVVQGRVDSL